MNIKVNHATLAKHNMQHEIAVAAKAGMLASIDTKRGDYKMVKIQISLQKIFKKLQNTCWFS